jgi:hypothetical protein
MITFQPRVPPAAGRTATPIKRRVGAEIGLRMIVFQPRVLPTAGSIATPTKRRVGDGIGMTNIPVAMTVASSTELHARTIA